MTATPPGAGTVVHLVAEVGAADDVTDLVVELARRVAVAARGDTAVLTVAARLAGPEPWCGAARAAVRGFVQSAALDLAPDLRCNLVLIGPDAATGSGDVDDAVAYAARVGPPGIGMTIDLR